MTLKYNQAKQEFEHALNHQQTISVAMLRRLMQVMNMSLEPSADQEVKYLKGEIKKLNRKLREKRA